jgi:hypothetical protein
MRFHPTIPIPEESPPQLPQVPELHPFVAEIASHEPEIVEGFGGQESLTGLRAKIWWQRHKLHLLAFVGLIVWVYLTCAWYCGDLTLGKCFYTFFFFHFFFFFFFFE